MQLTYFLLALGALMAGQAASNPIQAATEVASAHLELREVAAAAELNNVPRVSSEEFAYIEARDTSSLSPVIPHPNDDTLEMEEKRSVKGKKYHIVRPKGSAAIERASMREVSDSNLVARTSPWFKKKVFWPAGFSGITNIPFIDDTGILNWNIGTSWVPFYHWRLNFEVIYHWNYGFTDQEGDTYWCNAILSGTHYIDYNSGAASIVQVQNA